MYHLEFDIGIGPSACALFQIADAVDLKGDLRDGAKVSPDQAYLLDTPG